MFAFAFTPACRNHRSGCRPIKGSKDQKGAVSCERQSPFVYEPRERQTLRIALLQSRATNRLLLSRSRISHSRDIKTRITVVWNCKKWKWEIIRDHRSIAERERERERERKRDGRGGRARCETSTIRDFIVLVTTSSRRVCVTFVQLTRVNVRTNCGFHFPTQRSGIHRHIFETERHEARQPHGWSKVQDPKFPGRWTPLSASGDLIPPSGWLLDFQRSSLEQAARGNAVSGYVRKTKRCANSDRVATGDPFGMKEGGGGGDREA